MPPPQLSPDLRPLRYCPNCGQRLAQKAESCFMCGHDLQAGQRRRFRLPITDLLLVAVILGVAFLWWTRGTANEPGPDIPAQAAASVTASPPTPDPNATAGPISTPTATQTPTITPTPTPILYTVVRGDTIEGIAVEFGVNLEDLMIVNGLTSDLIRVDQKLVIPAGPLPRGPDGKPLPTATPTPKSAIYLVKVQSGDTLENIAARLGSTVNAILQANEELSNADAVIRPGDMVVVPVGTVLPAATADPAQEPTATPVPTWTPTPGPRWPAPQLLGPVNDANLSGKPVQLRWLSVGALAANESYVVRVVPQRRLQDELILLTVGSSVHAPEEWLAAQAETLTRFEWSVQIARDVSALTGQPGDLLATSPSSPIRTFLWGP